MAPSDISKSAYYITFKLGGETFAIPVASVREVLDLTGITRVPTSPHYMRGLVNVRGSAIPVIDLRIKLGLPPGVDDVNTRILVLELELDGEKTVVGVLADSVHDVIELEPHAITEAPRIAMRWRSELIDGLSKQGEQFVIILSIGRVLASDEAALDVAREAAAAATG